MKWKGDCAAQLIHMEMIPTVDAKPVTENMLHFEKGRISYCAFSFLLMISFIFNNWRGNTCTLQHHHGLDQELVRGLSTREIKIERHGRVAKPIRKIF